MAEPERQEPFQLNFFSLLGIEQLNSKTRWSPLTQLRDPPGKS